MRQLVGAGSVTLILRLGDAARVASDGRHVPGRDRGEQVPLDGKTAAWRERRQPWSSTIPAATVALVASSTSTKPPVVRLRRYSSAKSGCVVRRSTRPISLSPSPLGLSSRCRVLTSSRYWMSLTSARTDRVVCLTASLVPGRERLVGHPADHRVDVLGDVRGVVRAADHVAAGDVDLVRQPDRHRHRRERLVDRPVHRLDRGDPAGEAARQHHDLVAGLEDAARRPCPA